MLSNEAGSTRDEHGREENNNDEALDSAADLPKIPHHVNREIFTSSLRYLGLLVAALLVVGSIVGFLIAGAAGVWGALLGVAITVLFSGTTIWSMIYTADKSPNTTMAIVMGTWVAKMLVFVVAMAVLGAFDFYHRILFAVIVLIGVIGSALLDMRAVTQGRSPYVNPTNRSL